jgi:undecaprenyl-diphosphatase
LSPDIITILKAAVLGVIEGITEFLPVSSTGHLIVADRILHLSSDTRFVTGFEVVVQFGAILAIVALFWRRAWPWASPAAERPRVWALWLRIVVGVLPAVVAGFLLEDVITGRLFNTTVVAVALVVYGAALILVELALRRSGRGGTTTDPAALPLVAALAIGLFQCLALVPGTSRAAATILGGMILGLSRGAAAEFSFFLAVPLMAGATLLTVVRHGLDFTAGEWAAVGVGFVVSFAAALVVVRAFVGYLRQRGFIPFGIYRIVLGVLVLLVFAGK